MYLHAFKILFFFRIFRTKKQFFRKGKIRKSKSIIIFIIMIDGDRMIKRDNDISRLVILDAKQGKSGNMKESRETLSPAEVRWILFVHVLSYLYYILVQEEICRICSYMYSYKTM